MVFVLVLFLCAAAWAQSSNQTQTKEINFSELVSGVKGEEVVAVVNGKTMTAADIDRLIASLPPALQQNFVKQPKAFLEQWAMQSLIVEAAEKNKLAEQSPYKEQLELARRQILTNAQLTWLNANIVVTPEDEKRFYDANQERFREAQVRLIYIPFRTGSSSADSKSLTEDQARAKAEKIAADIRAGADFIEMVQKHSEDSASKEKQGLLSLGVRYNTNAVPEPMRKAILSAKQGDIVGPLRHDNGFYIFRIESSKILPLYDVRTEVIEQLKNQGLRNYMEDIKKRAAVEVKNEKYFNRQSLSN